jgi:hypothetical protein
MTAKRIATAKFAHETLWNDVVRRPCLRRVHALDTMQTRCVSMCAYDPRFTHACIDTPAITRMEDRHVMTYGGCAGV